MDQNYSRGFADTCSRYGLNPGEVAKSAQDADTVNDKNDLFKGTGVAPGKAGYVDAKTVPAKKTTTQYRGAAGPGPTIVPSRPKPRPAPPKPMPVKKGQAVGVLDKLFGALGRGVAKPVASVAGMAGHPEYGRGLMEALEKSEAGKRMLTGSMGDETINALMKQMYMQPELQTAGKWTAGTLGAGALGTGALTAMGGEKEPDYGYPQGY